MLGFHFIVNIIFLNLLRECQNYSKALVCLEENGVCSHSTWQSSILTYASITFSFEENIGKNVMYPCMGVSLTIGVLYSVFSGLECWLVCMPIHHGVLRASEENITGKILQNWALSCNFFHLIFLIKRMHVHVLSVFNRGCNLNGCQQTIELLSQGGFFRSHNHIIQIVAYSFKSSPRKQLVVSS